MKVLIIGGTGFIGTHIVDQFIPLSADIIVLSRSGECLRPPLPNVTYITGSLSDRSSLKKALNGVDTVVHAASSTVPSTANKNPVHDIESNLIATVILLEEMRKADVKRLVFISSGGTVYGIPQHLPISETHPLKPISSYGIVKVAIENYIQMEAAQHGLAYVILRAANPYGPRQNGKGVQGVIGTFLHKIINNEEIEIWGDGSVIRDFIYIEDLARLCRSAAIEDLNGIYNVGSGAGHSLNEIIEIISTVMGRNIVPSRIEARAYDVPKSVLDISCAQQAFNWSPLVNLEQGIRETLKWLN